MYSVIFQILVFVTPGIFHLLLQFWSSFLRPFIQMLSWIFTTILETSLTSFFVSPFSWALCLLFPWCIFFSSFWENVKRRETGWDSEYLKLTFIYLGRKEKFPGCQVALWIEGWSRKLGQEKRPRQDFVPRGMGLGQHSRPVTTVTLWGHCHPQVVAVRAG